MLAPAGYSRHAQRNELSHFTAPARAPDVVTGTGRDTPRAIAARCRPAVIRSEGNFVALDCPGLEWRDGDAPYSALYADGYSARGDTLAESTHVFLDGNRLDARFGSLEAGSFCVAELGFGSGCNFLLTRDLFLRQAPASARLHYRSVERNPMPPAALRRALERWPGLAPAGQSLLDAYPPAVSGVHRRLFDGGRVVLDLLFSDVELALSDLASFEQGCVDAWFLDGFAPSRNPEMWTDTVFQTMAILSRPGATLASYSTAGAVRRGLGAAGFALAKRPGYGSKREALCGEIQEPRRREARSLTPWDLPPAELSPPEQQAIDGPVLVIGAGLAGAHSAAALARRGIPSLVVDAGARAGRASGNPQGVLFTRLSHRRSALADFSLLSFLYAADLYAQLFRQGRLRVGLDGELGGCLQLPTAEKAVSALYEALQDLPTLATGIDAEAARLKLGAPLAGLWLPRSGWFSPPAVCAALLDDPLIELREHCGELHLERCPTGVWKLLDGDAACLAKSRRVIVAAGTGSGDLLAAAELPLKRIRGQTTQIPAPPSDTLQASLCHSGYITPALAGEHCIGATFQPGDEDLSVRTEDHRANLENLADALPAWRPFLETLDPASLAGRAELRCASPDYLPMVGPVPDPDGFRGRFQALGRNARRVLDQRGVFQPGLYVNTAHGSRGLSYAALAAELLASQVCGEPAPLSRELCRALAPARFVIRELSRGTAPVAKAS